MIMSSSVSVPGSVQGSQQSGLFIPVSTLQVVVVVVVVVVLLLLLPLLIYLCLLIMDNADIFIVDIIIIKKIIHSKGNAPVS